MTERPVPRIETLEHSDHYGKFVVEPLERGYGVTLGNSLRRVLLSSLPGDGRPPASGIGLVEPDGAGAALEVDYREVIPPLAAARPRWVGARHRRLVVQLPG